VQKTKINEIKAQVQQSGALVLVSHITIVAHVLA
jgi:hypothetical protein